MRQDLFDTLTVIICTIVIVGLLWLMVMGFLFMVVFSYGGRLVLPN